MRRVIAILLVLIHPGSPADARQAVSTAPRRNFANWGPNNIRPAIIHGHNPRVRVLLPSRLDWSYACPAAALATAPAELRAYDPSAVVYSLWVPRLYKHATPHPLVLHLSPKAFPDEGGAWADVGARHAALIATVSTGGPNAHPALRLRIALDVLDDLRRRMAIDTDRIYIAGQGDCARTACGVAFAYPEFVAGVVAIGGGASPRQEPWMRDRMKERLSVAYITGPADPARREVEVLRHPVTRDLGVRTRLWGAPMAANAMPPPAVLGDAFVWQEAALPARRALALAAPTTRMADGVVPLAEAWARGVLDEAKARKSGHEQKETGLLQLAGLAERWAGGDAARKAGHLLDAHDERAKTKWKDVYNRHQLRFAYLEARAFADFVGGPLPQRELPRKAALLEELAGLCEQVGTFGPDSEEAREVSRRLEALRKQMPAR